jgi:molybdopterin/thiamine biosynthesis adenylyltransferase
MSGWSEIILVDPDVMDEANLVKHPASRIDLGRPKVNIAKSWLLDRNPASQVEGLQEDVMLMDEAKRTEIFESADIVVSATDSNSVRHFVNDLCLEARTPMTVGSVHRGGIGGTVLLVRPGQTGCYACMEMAADGLDGLPNEGDLPPTEDELEMVYGRGMSGYAAAGLSADIGLVASVHAQVTVAELLRIEGAASSQLAAITENWIPITIRCGAEWSWSVGRVALPPLEGCVSCGEETD